MAIILAFILFLTPITTAPLPHSSGISTSFLLDSFFLSRFLSSFNNDFIYSVDRGFLLSFSWLLVKWFVSGLYWKNDKFFYLTLEFLIGFFSRPIYFLYDSIDSGFLSAPHTAFSNFGILTIVILDSWSVRYFAENNCSP